MARKSHHEHLRRVPLFAGLDFKLAAMMAFALSFSSTVFVAKALEEKGEMKSLHGRIAISILVVGREIRL